MKKLCMAHALQLELGCDISLGKKKNTKQNKTKTKTNGEYKCVEDSWSVGACWIRLSRYHHIWRRRCAFISS